MLALSLLIAAQQPNVPENLKIQATKTALYAISVAQSDLKTTQDTRATLAAPEVPTAVKEAVLEQKTSSNIKVLDNGCQLQTNGKNLSGARIVYCPK